MQTLTEMVDDKFLAKFEIRDSYKHLMSLRNFIRQNYEESALEYVPKRSYQQTELHFIVSAVDSNEANLLEVLQDDLEDFFFGVPIVIETAE
jgi:hypothetical protein